MCISSEKNVATFAGIPQSHQKTQARLRESRKAISKRGDGCGNPAKPSENVDTVAGKNI
ncbi:MAG: hypothetical protein LBT50_09870 [Prevotellaceae bacterium]|jgi:hypothetical protein|nr:hypothetical protein [Prevotellaceae bacterium]